MLKPPQDCLHLPVVFFFAGSINTVFWFEQTLKITMRILIMTMTTIMVMKVTIENKKQTENNP